MFCTEWQLCTLHMTKSIDNLALLSSVDKGVVMRSCVLAIDQGTTSTRAILFDQTMRVLASAAQELPQYFPQSGWVEHNPEEIWQSVLGTCRRVIAKARLKPESIVALGITNQRETTVIWDRATGRPIAPAIVWQDRRTAKICGDLRKDGFEKVVQRKTGLLLDPYFSATKIGWLLDHVEGARARAEAGELAFGTIDSFLLWRLTGGTVHATDATNASRTSLLDIHRGEWSKKLCRIFNVPRALLPEVRDCAAEFGRVDPAHFGAAIPVRGMAGDQHAAMIGQACFKPGMVKSTYGTGCFALLNTGDEAVSSKHNLLTTIAYQFKGERTYALEGSIFIAGAAVQWLRDGLKLIRKAGEAEIMAARSDPDQQVILVPAFVGVGAPYWDADCRGALFGLTRNTGAAEIARATLEAVCFQSRDLLEAMRKDWGHHADPILRVDGGMATSNWTMQRLADLVGVTVERPLLTETTALGVAYLAGLQSGLYPDLKQFAESWQAERRFLPDMSEQDRKRLYSSWKDAVARTLSHR